MKLVKLFSIIALCAATFNLNAATYNKAKITVTGQTGDAKGVLNLVEKSSTGSILFTSSGADDEIQMYVVSNSVKYSTLFNPALDGLKLGFKGNTNTTYTMTFTVVAGEMKIYDAVEDSVIVPVENGTYTFTCDANTEITDRFQVGEPTYTREVTAGDWGTICLPWASMALEGATYYETLGTKNADGIALAEVSALEAGKPYVFQATAAEIKVIYNPSTEVQTEVAGEKCTGSFAGCTVPEGQYLIVDNLLYKAEGTGNSIDANRAYFDVANMTAYTPAPGRRVVFFGGKTTPTNVAEVEAPAMKDGKMMIDGQLVIIKGGKMFNAQGAAL